LFSVLIQFYDKERRSFLTMVQPLYQGPADGDMSDSSSSSEENHTQDAPDMVQLVAFAENVRLGFRAFHRDKALWTHKLFSN
jgi:hypothetical protein